MKVVNLSYHTLPGNPVQLHIITFKDNLMLGEKREIKWVNV